MTSTGTLPEPPPLQRLALHFSLDEALAKVGRQVRVATPIADVPANAIGTVLAVSGGKDRAMVLVEWNAWRLVAASSRHTTPLGRWFNRPDYEDALIEI